MTALSYRLRIRDAADAANDLIVTSVRGGANPYLKAPPSGDGQELDVLMGTLRQGVYTAEIVDEITSGTTRVFTSKLFDASGRQVMLSRRAYFEISTDGGATWPQTLLAGYVINYNLADAITWSIQVGDTRRVEQNALVFDGASTRFTARGCLFGGPIFDGFGPVVNRGGWTFVVKSVTTLSADYKLVSYGFVSGFRGSKDQRTTDLFTALGIRDLPAQQAPINVAAESLGRAPALPARQATLIDAVVPGIGLSTFPGSNGCFPGVQIRVYNSSGTLLGRMTPATSLDGWNMITPYYTPTNFAILWPTTITSPSVNDVHTLYAIGVAVTEVSPAYVDLHPVDYATTIWQDLGIDYDTTAAATVKDALGPTLRLAMRITKSEKALDFLNRVIFGPFGIAVRNNVSGQRELIRTRLRNSGNPTTTVTTAMLRSQSEVIFANDEGSVISSVRFKGEIYTSFDDSNSIDQQKRPLDGILVRLNEVVVQSGDVSTFGTKEVLYDFGGMIHDALAFGDQSAMLIEATGNEIFNRFGHGAPEGEFRVVRFIGDGLWGDVNDDGVVDFADAAEMGAYGVGLPVSNPAAFAIRGDVSHTGNWALNQQQTNRYASGLSHPSAPDIGTPVAGVSVPNVGDEIYLEPAHLPNANKRFGDDPSVGARIVQIVRRTEEPAGPYYKVIDAGSDQQPISPAATISIAANATAPRSIAEFTITNAAAINAAVSLIVAVEWGTGASSPAGGAPFTRFKAGACPVAAVQLPSVTPGSKVWVRARTEQDGRRPSAWTAWTSVTLTAMTAPNTLTFTNLRKNAAQFNWINANATDLIDVFVFKGGSPPGDWSPYFVTTLKQGSTSIVVRGLDGPSVGYVGAVMHRDPATAARSAAVTGTFTTNSTLDTAPDMDGILVMPAVKDASLPVGIVLALYPFDQNFNIEIERAPDSSGSPGTYAALTTVPGTQQIFVDYLPSNGATYWYRARSSLSGYTPSAYTADVSGIPGGVSPSVKAGVAPLVPLILSITVSVKPDGSGTISVQGNDKTLSFKLALGGSNPSDATVRAASPTAGPQADISFNSLSYPTGIYVGAFPYSGAAGAGTEGPRHNLFVSTLNASIPQGTVFIDASGNASFTVDAPAGVGRIKWLADYSSFPADSTVAASGNTITSAPPYSATVSPALTLGQTLFITVVPFSGSDLAVQMPGIHLRGSYQSFSATKTLNYSASAWNPEAVYTNILRKGSSVGVPIGPVGSYGFSAQLTQPQGCTLTGASFSIFQSAGSGGNALTVALKRTSAGTETSLGSASASQVGAETLTVSCSDSTTGNKYFVTGDITYGYTPTSGVLREFAITWTMPTPDKAV